MRHLEVALQVGEAGERLPTDGALKRLFSRVHSLVDDSIRLRLERASAKLARKALTATLAARTRRRRIRSRARVELVPDRINPSEGTRSSALLDIEVQVF